MKNIDLTQYIYSIPKMELHIHIEGTLEPELMFKIAKRNKVKIKYKTVEELKKAYSFNNLQEFLDLYYEGAKVLLEEQDFYDLTFAYLKKVHAENVVHTEIFFDPQTHTDRGVTFAIVINGIKRALDDGKAQFGISSKLIMCFLRHLSQDAALKTLEIALPYKNWIIGVGLDSSEVGNPPSKFKNVFDKARQLGFLTVAHAGEEGAPDYIWEAVNILKVSRIDHGNSCLGDSNLVTTLAKTNMPLTLCPLSNLSLKVINNLKDHPLLNLMNKDIVATINSDDPAYFGGYITENFLKISEALNLTKNQIYKLALNSINASFLNNNEKDDWIEKLNRFHQQYSDQ